MLLTINEMIDNRLIEDSLIKESVEQDNMVDIFKSLEDVHKKLFHDSWQSVYYVDSNLRIPKDVVLFRSTIYNKSKWGQGFKENDPMDAIFTIQHIGDNKYQVTLAKGKHLRTKESYTKNKLDFRKAKGDAQTVIKKITEWETKRKAMLDANKEHMH